MKNELKVEHYDASEVEAKKKKILKRVATGVGATALVTVLGYYGLVQNKKCTEPIVTETLDTVPVIEFVKDLDTVPIITKKDLDTVPVPVKKKPKTVKKNLDTVPPPIEPIEIEEVPMIEFIMGGNGAWFNSVIEFLG